MHAEKCDTRVGYTKRENLKEVIGIFSNIMHEIVNNSDIFKLHTSNPVYSEYDPLRECMTVWDSHIHEYHNNSEENILLMAFDLKN